MWGSKRDLVPRRQGTGRQTSYRLFAVTAKDFDFLGDSSAPDTSDAGAEQDSQQQQQQQGHLSEQAALAAEQPAAAGVPETARGFRRQATASKGSSAGRRAAAAFTPIEGVPEKDSVFERTPAGNRAWQAQLAQQLEADLQAAGEATPPPASRSAAAVAGNVDAAVGMGGSQGEDEAGVTASDMADAMQNVDSLVAGITSASPNTPLTSQLQGRAAKSRKSLAGDGLQLGADGRRVSTRQRQKPMEFWRNERVEYARDHRSLPTVKTRVAVTPDPAWPAPDPQHDRKRKQQKQLEQEQLEQQQEQLEQEQAAADASSGGAKKGRGRPPGSKKGKH
ncbi:hypothetical protein OEZ85_006369 [Tetradesmus obliquus]|uniref:MBD domain-containing protein n=1 Tax=Tetradesmus obliquus TaxID=3088 RepID=A0ABY8TUE2_TETOB|nr:hypothetical protein OEZ85_006369 [Tetradesmus obliquus]